MEDEGQTGPGKERPANDNHPPDGQDSGQGASPSARLDAVVLSIARLIGRRMAREDHEKAFRAANDNAPPSRDGAEAEAEDPD